MKVMDRERKFIEGNQTWELTKLPYGAKKIEFKYMYKTKYNENDKVEK